MAVTDCSDSAIRVSHGPSHQFLITRAASFSSKAFRPPPLCVEDPHPTRQSPGPQKLIFFVLFFLGCRKWGCNKWGFKGCLAALPRNQPKAAFFSPFFCLFRPFLEGLKSTWKIQKTEEKGLFPQMSSDFLKPPSLKPPFAAPQFSCLNHDSGEWPTSQWISAM